MFQKLLQSLPYTSIDSSCTHKDMHLRGFVKNFAALDREKLPMPYNMMFIIGCIFRCIISRMGNFDNHTDHIFYSNNLCIKTTY